MSPDLSYNYTYFNEPYKKINNLSPVWGVMMTRQENLNRRIGIQSWKKYMSAAFWNYISTPINFVITLFTAISAGQSGSQRYFLSQQQTFYILFVSFVLSIINTFFKLKEKAKINYDAAKKYDEFGASFERIYFKPIINDDDVYNKFLDYQTLQKQIDDYYIAEDIETVNYITEIVFIIARRFISGNMSFLKINERYWLLDGKPNSVNYSKNFKVDIDSYFIDNFNKTEQDGNKFWDMKFTSKRNDNKPSNIGDGVNDESTQNNIVLDLDTVYVPNDNNIVFESDEESVSDKQDQPISIKSIGNDIETNNNSVGTRPVEPVSIKSVGNKIESMKTTDVSVSNKPQIRQLQPFQRKL